MRWDGGWNGAAAVEALNATMRRVPILSDGGDWVHGFTLERVERITDVKYNRSSPHDLARACLFGARCSGCVLRGRGW